MREGGREGTNCVPSWNIHLFVHLFVISNEYEGKREKHVLY